jgi:endonuclease/exonuclease/phosphatase family metal-dependent hydrolase
VPLRDDGVIALQVATFNIRYENTDPDKGRRLWRERLKPVIATLSRINPDVFGVQEALHGQVADLWASLPDYGFHGIGRDDGQRAGEYSGIFYRNDRFEPDLGDCGTFWLSDTPEKPGSMTWGNKIPRIAAWIRLTDRATGRSFYVFNTHWDHQNQPSREGAAKLITARIDGRRHADEPVVLVGDFNAIEDNPAVGYLRGKPATLMGRPSKWEHGLVDSYNALHPNDPNRTTLHFWEGSRAGIRCVDHILVQPGARILLADIAADPEPLPSDHFPVFARIEFPLASSAAR